MKTDIRGRRVPPQHVRTWQDMLLLAILECDPVALADALDAHGDTALQAVLHRKEVQKEGIFILADQVFPRAGALREALGGDFRFEQEESRSRISLWLDMIGARAG